jgi:hypothetical protein
MAIPQLLADLDLVYLKPNSQPCHLPKFNRNYLIFMVAQQLQTLKPFRARLIA